MNMSPQELLDRRNKILNFYNIQDFDAWIIDLYVNQKLSTFEISEKIAKDTGILFNARSIQRILNKKKVMRTVNDSFQLAIEKGRVRWMLQEYKDKVKRKNISESVRFRVLSNAKYQCELCHNPDRLTIDHKISLSNGGTDDISNLQALCWPCNVGKREVMDESRPGSKFVWQFLYTCYYEYKIIKENLMKPTKPINRKTIVVGMALLPQHMEYIENLMNRKAFMSKSDVVRRAIEFFHDATFPDYIYNKSATDKKKRTEIEQKEKKEAMTDEDFATNVLEAPIYTTPTERIIVIHWFYNSIKALSLAGCKDLPLDVVENHKALNKITPILEELKKPNRSSFLKENKVILG